MELPIEDELLARAVGWEIIRYMKREDLLERRTRELECDAMRVLETIRCILNNSALSDPECFQQIDRIVQAFYAYGIYTNRHDME